MQPLKMYLLITTKIAKIATDREWDIPIVRKETGLHLLMSLLTGNKNHIGFGLF